MKAKAGRDATVGVRIKPPMLAVLDENKKKLGWTRSKLIVECVRLGLGHVVEAQREMLNGK